MLVGVDLGFSYLVLVFSFVGPVFFFLVHRRWRRSVVRKEEIKRLLILAAEEAARAEFEATTGYLNSAPSISPPLQFQCAVCFCPTTTRCARCKAVRYCSGKCQIIHWRQGHKEECRPFAIHDNSDKGCNSAKNASKQEINENDGNNCETEDSQHSKSIGDRPEELASSNLDSSSEGSCLNDESEVECLVPGEGTDSDIERLSEHDFNVHASDKGKGNGVNEVDQNKPSLSEKTSVGGSIIHFSGPPKVHQHKPRIVVPNSQNVSSRSESSFGSDFNESPLPELSTPSADFWEGTINSGSARIDTHGDLAQIWSSRDGNCDADMVNSPENSSFNLQRSMASTIGLDGSSDPTPKPLGMKRPVDRTALSDDAHRDASKAISLPSCRSISASKSGCTQSCPEEPSHTSHPLVSKSGGSGTIFASDAHLSSSIRISSVEGATSMEANGPYIFAKSSSQFTDHSSKLKNGLKASVLKVVEQASKSSQHYLSGVSSEIAGRYDNKGLFPYDLFVKLYHWKKVELLPCGLINCGNSCYANAVLQCLAFTSPLTAYFLQGSHSKACLKKEWCFTCEFESIILKAKGGISPLSPIGILSHIQNIGSHLGNGKQEDAHEFLRYAIDTMQSVCLKEGGANASGCMEETTLIGLTFGGYLRSKIKCMKCGGKSERHERMMDLTVEIDGDIGTLEEALGQFTATEILDGENKYHCSRCKSYEKARKKLTVYEAPNILTVALKRFQSGKFGKLNKSIKFPETLDLAPCMSGTSDKSPIYRLYGVVVHLDIMNATFSGHYVCYIKNVQNKWFKIDDSTVKAVGLENVLTKGAYMLLYARCSPRAPRLIRNPIMLPCDLRKSKCHTSKHECGLASYHGICRADLLNVCGPNPDGLYPIRSILDEDSSSENSSSIFSEECSCSTESSNVDSTSSEDIIDQLLGDFGRHWNSPWRNSSDSDSSSPLSSSFLYARHSPLDSDPILYPDSGKPCRKLVSTSYRETDLDRSGRGNIYIDKKDGVSLRRSMRERTN